MKFKYPLEKIVVNIGIGRLTTQAGFEDKILPEVKSAVAAFTGQKAQERPARISISGFKLRQGTVVGLKVTLRRQRMMQFLAKVNNIVLPRIRDFRGISTKGIDQSGNLTFGIKEHIVFPEIVLEETNANFGVEITLVPKEKIRPEKAPQFYRELGLPLQKQTKEQIAKSK